MAIETKRKQETAVLVGVINREQNERQVNDYLDELSFLTETAGGIPLKRFVQKSHHPNPKTYIGSGKVEEIKDFVIKNEVDLILFDDDLSATQLKNLEIAFEKKVLDRTNLILDIFAARARTAYAKTQVELAQYEYLLPRLTRMWTHLERQRGGIGLRGPGETEIETDRRIIRDKIARLKEQLSKIDKQMASQRKHRGNLVRVALVGYTNVGKSTLMNLLCKTDILAENKLFATLDTTVRKVIIGNLPFLLCDTVGFIRKLPTHLIESFKSTLDEVRDADILLHVVDISHKSHEEQIQIVNQTLQDIRAVNKPVILIFNKMDAYHYIQKEADDLTPATKENISPDDMQKSWLARENHPCIFISAKHKQNIQELKNLLYEKVKEIHRVRYPYDHFLY